MISEHFERKEFACPCGCGFDTVDVELVNVLEMIRERFKEEVIINSGSRCVHQNIKVGGARQSYHLRGQAADIVVANVEAEVVADFLDEMFPEKYGVGRYEGRTHIDVRAIKARWRG